MRLIFYMLFIALGFFFFLSYMVTLKDLILSQVLVSQIDKDILKFRKTERSILNRIQIIFNFYGLFCLLEILLKKHQLNFYFFSVLRKYYLYNHAYFYLACFSINFLASFEKICWFCLMTCGRLLILLS